MYAYNIYIIYCVHIYISNIHALKLYVYVYTCNIKVEIKLPWGTKKTNKREGEEEGNQQYHYSLLWFGQGFMLVQIVCSVLFYITLTSCNP